MHAMVCDDCDADGPVAVSAMAARAAARAARWSRCYRGSGEAWRCPACRARSGRGMRSGQPLAPADKRIGIDLEGRGILRHPFNRTQRWWTVDGDPEQVRYATIREAQVAALSQPPPAARLAH